MLSGRVLATSGRSVRSSDHPSVRPSVRRTDRPSFRLTRVMSFLEVVEGIIPQSDQTAT